jgi:Domain of unknown function (DUF4389)
MTEGHETPKLEGQEAPRAPNPWFRLPYLVLFVIIFEVVKLIVELIAIVQFVLRVVSGHSNERLRSFGAGLGRYLGDVVNYLTYATDATPYPFGPWPGE